MTTYRPDIDGLRALAILPVVLFHADIPGFAGGYIGVDVFFVISGFLITSIIRGEISAGRFSIVRFYERRARRILPALFVMLAASVVLAAITLYPHQFLAFSRSVVAASLFVSSFLFESEDGYFDLESEQKPLLHTWSLSVEEIFYIVFPLILLGLRRQTQNRQIAVLGGIAGMSLLISSVALNQDPRSPSAFFLPYSRAWEIMLGALLAYNVIPRVRRWMLDGLSVLGIAVILLAVLSYSGDTIFPGTAAALPCVGAALIIYTGQHGPTIGGRFLSNPGIVWVGGISYSLYLWHWPLLVFAQAAMGDDLSRWSIGAVIAASFALAAVSTRLVERPFRGRHAILSRHSIFTFSGIGIALFTAIGLAGIYSDGWSGRYPPEVARILFAERDRDPRRDCLSTKPEATGCVYGEANAKPRVALWGDSHAAVYAVMLGELAREHNQSLLTFTMPSCPPLAGWALANQAWRETCIAFQNHTMQELLNAPSVRSIVFAARFAGYPINDSGSGFEVALRRTIEELQRAGKNIFIVYPVPELGAHVPTILARALESGALGEQLSQPFAEFQARLGTVSQFLDRVVADKSITAINPSRVLCDEDRCYFYRDGEVLYYDEHHLSLTGASKLAPLFEGIFGPP